MRAWCISLLAIFVIMSAKTARSAESMKVWPDDSVEIKDVKPKDIPTLELWPAASSAAKKPAILICPAGGYKFHSESTHYAKWLNGLGISAYIVKYRLPGEGYKHPAPFNDARRAMQIIRKNAGKWELDPSKIGVMGGSSGGHVASTLATHFSAGDKDAVDPFDQQSSRPDFVILSDAVITMQGKACHTPSRGRLLPKNPPKELVDNLSNELRVTAESPPTFLVAGGQDQLVPAENSMMFFSALRKLRVPFCELHFFSHGGHGFQTPEWSDLAAAWLRRLNVLPPKEGEKPWTGQFDKGAWDHGDELSGG